MTHNVRILSAAQRDIERCFAFIAQRSPRGAANWFNQFAETRDSLGVDPHQRALAPESDYVSYDLRQVMFRTRKGKPYRILFTVHSGEVLVLRVRGPGQDFVPTDEVPDRSD